MRNRIAISNHVTVFLVGIMLLLALILVACGGGDSDEGSDPGSGAGETNIEDLPGMVVVLEGNKCPPVFAAAGDEITWLNSSGGPVVVRERDAVGGSDFDSGVLQAGESYTYVFEQFGSYGYECSEDGTQRGSITVSP